MLKGIYTTKSNKTKRSGYITHTDKASPALIVLGSIIATTIISGLSLSSSLVSADESVVDQIDITVPISCTLSGNGMNTHNANINNGLYEPNIGTTTLHAFCNDNEGFAIYAAGYTGNEVGGTNSNKLVGTTASGNATIDSGIATTAGNPDISNWAMKLAISQDSGDTTGTNAFTIDSAPNVALPSEAESGATQVPFSSYHVVPNEYTKVAHKNSGTDMTDTTGGVKLTTTYAAYISKTQAADTYSGQVKYVLVHPSSAAAPFVPHEIDCEPGKICYNANAGNVLGVMGTQSLEKEKDWSQCTSGTDYASICYDSNGQVDISTLPELDTYAAPTLWASNFQRAGYGFAGWTDKYNWVLNQNDQNGNGTGSNAGYHIYGPNETITDTTTINNAGLNGLSLYAVWVPSNGNLQGWTGCSNLSTGQVTALTDTRDDDTYTVAKLKDNNCWMIENLRLESTAAHNSDGTLAQGYGTSTTYGNFSGLANAESTNFSDSTTANSIYYSVTQSGDATINIGTTNYPGYRMPRYNNQNTNSPSTNMTVWNNTINVYSLGNYYTWYAAIADTTFYNTEHQSITTTSICPTGWHLPTGGNEYNASNSEYWKLSLAIMDNVAPDQGGMGFLMYSNAPTNADGKTASQVFRSYPNNFIHSGMFSDSSANSRSAVGYYWSSTVYGNYSSYRFSLDSNFVMPASYEEKYIGHSIRCSL